MKKLLTQFGKELRDSTQSTISQEVLNFLSSTSLTDEEEMYLTKTISGEDFSEVVQGTFREPNSIVVFQL